MRASNNSCNYIPTHFLILIGIIFSAFAVSCGSSLAENKVGLNTFDLVSDCGARGDGATDDSLALKKCLTMLQGALNRNGPGVLRIPAGIFRITGENGRMPLIERHGGTIQGAGPHASYFVLDRSYSGDLFSWSESWIGKSSPAIAGGPSDDAAGATIIGIQIDGDSLTRNDQNAFVFYDRNDFVLIRDVEIFNVNGYCLSIGNTLRMPIGYMRESAFYNVKCWHSGTGTKPAIELGSTTQIGSDASNQLDFYKLAVFASKGTGLEISNPTAASSTRRISFYGLRVEASGTDGIVIGGPSDRGQVSDIDMDGLVSVGSRQAALRIGAGKAAPQPYSISVRGGTIGPGNHTGIAIEAGRLIDIQLTRIEAPILLGSRLGPDVEIRGNGAESGWLFEDLDPARRSSNVLDLRNSFYLRGLPNAGDRVGAVALQGETSTDLPMELTMDGKPANSSNCVSLDLGQTLNLDVHVVATNIKYPFNWYAWTLPLGVLFTSVSNDSATWRAGAFVSESGGTGRDSQVVIDIDRIHRCLNFFYSPPPGNVDRWNVSALVEFTGAYR